jgi:Winged helix-turn helix
MFMEKENARKQTLEQLHERRKQVVSLHKKALGVMQIVSMTGVSYPAVRACINLFEAGGWPAIRPAQRGRAPGLGRALSAAQEEAIQRTIIDQRPERSRWTSSFGVGLLLGSSLSRNTGSSCTFAALANTSSAGASPRKSPSSAPMNKTLWRYRHGGRASSLA